MANNLDIERAFTDLYWSICSERLFNALPGLDLLQSGHITASTAINTWSKSERLRQQLIELLATSKSTRLGVYYEDLWRFYLSHSPDGQLLQHNLQVNAPGRTVGEFDFIYRNATISSAVHLETAVKFYLGVPEDRNGTNSLCRDFSPWSRWVGPGLKDRLDLKLNQLSQKQLRLQSDPAAQNLLGSLELKTDMAAELQMAGRLFYPMNAMPPPSDINPHHEKGRWFTVSQLLSHYSPSLKNKHSTLLSRAEWLAPLNLPLDSARAVPVSEMLEEIQQGPTINEDFQPFQFCQLRQTSAYWEEEFRAFVVPDSWPGRAFDYADGANGSD